MKPPKISNPRKSIEIYMRRTDKALDLIDLELEVQNKEVHMPRAEHRSTLEEIKRLLKGGHVKSHKI